MLGFTKNVVKFHLMKQTESLSLLIWTQKHLMCLNSNMISSITFRGGSVSTHKHFLPFGVEFVFVLILLLQSQYSVSAHKKFVPIGVEFGFLLVLLLQSPLLISAFRKLYILYYEPG